MPHPEEVSHDHIDATVTAFLKAEKDLQWTEIALVTPHPRQEIHVVLRENAEKYRGINDARFVQLLAGLKAQAFHEKTGPRLLNKHSYAAPMRRDA